MVMFMCDVAAVPAAIIVFFLIFYVGGKFFFLFDGVSEFMFFSVTFP